MEFIGDPQEEKLRTMQEFIRFWAWSQKERRRTGVNPLYSLMMSVRNAEEELKRIEQKVADKDNPNAARRGLTLGKPIPITKIEKQLIGGTLGKIIPTSLATFSIYFVIGIWHGANWRYIAYGFWNGALITLALLMAPWFAAWKRALRIDDRAAWYKVFQVLRTCFLVFLGRYLTRAPRLLTALWMIKETFLQFML